MLRISRTTDVWDRYDRAYDESVTKRVRRCPLNVFEEALLPISVSAIQRGHDVMDKLRLILTKFRRNELQKQMHEYMLSSIVRYVYGDDCVNHELEILAYNRFEEIKQEVLITAPRRFGKSTGTAQFIAACMYCIPNCEASVFSSGKRASSKKSGFMGIVMKCLIQDLGVEKFSAETDEDLFFEVSKGDIRKLHCYPGSVHTYVFLPQTKQKKK